MTRTQKAFLVVLIALSTALAFWFFESTDEQATAEETGQAEACDSCSARHKNLTRLRDARVPTVKKESE